MIEYMEQFLIYLTLVLVGLCLGSFAGALTWRMRARQLVVDKDLDEPYDKNEYKKLKKLTATNILHDRSQCLHCGYVLKWYDLIPILSWLSLRGKCRECRSSIGYLEPAVEIGMMLFFVLSYIFWPYSLTTPIEITRFVVWLVSGVPLAILVIYDAKWFLLPDKAVFSLIGLGALSSLLVILQSNDVFNTVANIMGAIVILSGLYLAVYLASKGRWIGFGDVKLGLGLALLLADWQLAFIALFAANIIGCLWVLPAMIAGKIKRQSHVPFGPLLILGFIVAGLAGSYLIEVYISLLI